MLGDWEDLASTDWEAEEWQCGFASDQGSKYAWRVRRELLCYPHQAMLREKVALVTCL